MANLRAMRQRRSGRGPLGEHTLASKVRKPGTSFNLESIMNSSISPGLGSVTHAGYAPSVTDQPDASFTDQIVERLRAALGTNSEAEQEQNALFERLFGAVAIGSNGGGEKGSTQIPSRADAIFDLIAMLERSAASVASMARALNSRI